MLFLLYYLGLGLIFSFYFLDDYIAEMWGPDLITKPWYLRRIFRPWFWRAMMFYYFIGIVGWFVILVLAHYSDDDDF